MNSKKSRAKFNSAKIIVAISCLSMVVVASLSVYYRVKSTPNLATTIVGYSSQQQTTSPNAPTLSSDEQKKLYLPLVSSGSAQAMINDAKQVPGFIFYVDTELNFSIQYPNDWYIEKHVVGRGVDFANFEPPFLGIAGSIPEGCHFSVVIINDNDPSFVQVAQSINNLKVRKSGTERQVDGINSVTHLSPFADPAYKEHPQTVVNIRYPDRIVNLGYWTDPSVEAGRCSSIFETMLNTFHSNYTDALH